MEIEFFEDIDKFYRLTYNFLLRNEAENNLLFSILNTIKKNPKHYGEENPVLTIVKENDKVMLVSLRTPPYNQILSYTDDISTIDLLTKELFYRSIELPGVIGFKEGARKFVQLWCESKKLSPELIRNERVYKLEEVAEETLMNREFIIATEENLPLILKWAKKFILEALPETSETQIKRSLEHLEDDINDKRFFLLMENREIVSMARKAGKTPNGNLVNLVYTPPELRRRGYATECVARLSKHLLQEGNKFCFLFTDLMNPVSNSIYLKIGYRPVIDVDEYKFITE